VSQTERILFDTSSLVAAMVLTHPAHVRSREWLARALQGEIVGFVCTHSLAECYAVLSGSPFKPRILPQQTWEMLQTNLKTLQTVSLNEEDYKAALELVAKLELPGGAIYDTLIAIAARKSNVSKLVTLNTKHFLRLGEAIAALVTEP
jgi:predicted nucleic acid-binding protein